MYSSYLYIVRIRDDPLWKNFLDFLTEIISFFSWIIWCKCIPIHWKMISCIHGSETFNSQRVLILNRPHNFVNSYFRTFWPLQGHMITITWFVIISNIYVCDLCNHHSVIQGSANVTNVTKVTHLMLYSIYYLYHM